MSAPLTTLHLTRARILPRGSSIPSIEDSFDRPYLWVTCVDEVPVHLTHEEKWHREISSLLQQEGYCHDLFIFSKEHQLYLQAQLENYLERKTPIEYTIGSRKYNLTPIDENLFVQWRTENGQEYLRIVRRMPLSDVEQLLHRLYDPLRDRTLIALGAEIIGSLPKSGAVNLLATKALDSKDENPDRIATLRFVGESFRSQAGLSYKESLIQMENLERKFDQIEAITNDPEFINRDRVIQFIDEIIAQLGSSFTIVNISRN